MGRIQGFETGFGLTARHCLAIGKYALKTGKYHALAVEWLELTKSLLISSKDTSAEIEENELNAMILEAVTTVRDSMNNFFYQVHGQ